MGGRTAAAAAGAGPDGGAARFGSILGARVLAPPGPLNATSRGVILSMRQPLTASPSVNFNGLAPFTAKIAILRPGSVTIPVRRVSARSEVPPPSLAAVCGGRRELLNSGRPEPSQGAPLGARSVGGGSAGAYWAALEARSAPARQWRRVEAR